MIDRRRKLELDLRDLAERIGYYERLLAEPDPTGLSYRGMLRATELRTTRNRLLANAVQLRFQWEAELQKIALDEWRDAQAVLDACEPDAVADAQDAGDLDACGEPVSYDRYPS